MADFPLNGQVRGLIRTKDVNQQLADATTVVVTVTKPDNSTATPSVSHPAVGIYTFDNANSLAGTYSAVGVSTGLVSAQTVTWTVA